jgi:uncharacterized protein (TIGR02271 family)
LARKLKRSGDQRTGAPLRENKPAVFPVNQEQTTVTKRVVETGKVHIAKRLREYEELVDIPHFQEEVHVRRVPVNQFVDDAPEVRTEGEVTIIPVLEERYVVEKRLFLTEELHVHKERKESHYPQKVKVLKEEVEVKRVAPGDTPATRTRAAKPRH